MKNAKIAYLVGVNDLTKVRSCLGSNTFIIQQTAISDIKTKDSDLNLPSTLPIEIDGAFLNLEGQFKKLQVLIPV